MISDDKKRMLLVTGSVGGIIVLCLLLGNLDREDSKKVEKTKEGNVTSVLNITIKRTKRRIIHRLGFVRPPNPDHPCSDRYVQKQWEQEVNFCYNTTQVSKTVIIPVSAFQLNVQPNGRRIDPSQWYGYDFYLDAHPVNTRTNWWGDVFLTTGKNWPTSSYGWTGNAWTWKQRVTNLTVDSSTVCFVLDSTKMPLGSTACSNLRLCAWSSVADPCWEIRLCPMFMTGTTIAANGTGGSLKTVGRPDRVKNIVIIDRETTVDDWFKVSTGITQVDNNWLLMVEQAAKLIQTDCIICLGARPLLHIVPSALTGKCLIEVMNNTNPNSSCSSWDNVYPLTTEEKNKPIFSSKVASGNFSCINRTGTGSRLGDLSQDKCVFIVDVNLKFRPKARSDIWWWCGGKKLYDRLPYNTTGVCASVSLILPVSILPSSVTELLTMVNSIYPHTWKERTKRAVHHWSSTDPTYIDSIGVPRGVPDEYKLVDQVAAGFESTLCWWCTINKNVDRINYIHYNVQKLGNKTEEGFAAIHEQLSATSLMAFQNRIAVDMLLAEKGGVCSIFGDQCCTFIPNNTAADGSLTKALEGLRSLNNKMKDHSGVDTSMWDGFGEVFGKYRQLALSILMSVTVFAAVLTVCGCCCIPCIRVLCTRMITTAIQPVKTEMTEMYALLTPNGGPGMVGDDSDEESSLNIPNLFSEQEDPYYPDLYPDPNPGKYYPPGYDPPNYDNNI